MKGLLGQCLKILSLLKAKHVLQSRLFILVSGGIISRNTDRLYLLSSRSMDFEQILPLSPEHKLERKQTRL